MHPWITEYRLAPPGGDRRHASVDGRAGACLGDLPLLDRSPSGVWRPRDRAALESTLSRHYGGPVDLVGRMPALAAVARALTEGDVVRAHIALLHARLPPLPERAVVVSANENGLAKQIAANYLTQPRIPAGARDAKPGTWTSIGAGGTAALDAAMAVARTIAGRATLVGAILIPGNIGQTRSGRVPGTDVDYGYAEGQLTLTFKDGDGHTRLIYDGSGDLNGQYRTPEGVLLAQAGPDGLAMAPGAIAALARGDRVFSQKTKTPNEGEPGTWAVNPGSGQQRLYGPDGYPVLDIDYDHDHWGVPHAHDWLPIPGSKRTKRQDGRKLRDDDPRPPKEETEKE
ncbi:hypothetical protein UAJ10_22770 [Nitrospirillum sp. BR 11164]|uniref:hypothetical protein n=1 Tax=Nitrospirillum sp. BR 11164 TaxID=3104324 RepID=UPI002B00329E|nr:hypothetical protein [Nitrospirillum sp. BR 11164]MEA1651824.1 hypothetical protein [Nitrospirillum sp. BR 11164]